MCAAAAASLSAYFSSCVLVCDSCFVMLWCVGGRRSLLASVIFFMFSPSAKIPPSQGELVELIQQAGTLKLMACFDATQQQCRGKSCGVD